MRIIRLYAKIVLMALLFYACSGLAPTTREIVFNDALSQKNDASLSATERYIKTYRELAIKEMRRTKIPASIKLAQGILESGNGESYLAKNGNNHFGIKCKGWTGKTIYLDDDEKGECFRVYNTVDESYRDHSDFLINGQRYRSLFELKHTDYKGWARGLKKAGYATRSNYAELVIGIIEKHQLYEYDNYMGDIQEANGKFRHNGILSVMAQSGDTYESIAKANKIQLSVLLKYNDVEDASQKLLPSDIVYLNPKRSKSKKANWHIVKEGESMHYISQEYGIRLNSLYSRNLLKKDEEPAVGEILFLRKRRKDPPRLRMPQEEPKAPVLSEIPVFTNEELIEIEKTEAFINSDTHRMADIPEVQEVPEEVPVNTPEPLRKTPVNKDALFHIVQRGETLYQIARTYDISMVELMRINQLENSDISVDDTLYLNNVTSTPEAAEQNIPTESKPEQDQYQINSHGDTLFHLVKAKETLYSISRQYEGVSISDIIYLNKLKNYDISPGQKLIIKVPDHGKQPQKEEKPIPTMKELEKKYEKQENNTNSHIESPDEPNSSAQFHIVQAKETLYSISRKYNISVEELKRINALTDNTLSVGQKLKIK
jgi:LysM repeat protein